MTKIIKIACDYLSELYDATYIEKGTLLFIKNNTSMFKLNLIDGERFGYYMLYHRYYKENKYWHRQLKTKSIFKALFHAFGHDFHKSLNLWIAQEDIDRFASDIKKMES